jgi:hypothetical protein
LQALLNGAVCADVVATKRSPKAVWTPAWKAGAPVIKSVPAFDSDVMTVWAVPIWPARWQGSPAGQ